MKIKIEDVTIDIVSYQGPGIPMGNADEIMKILMKHIPTGHALQAFGAFKDHKDIKEKMYEKLEEMVAKYEEKK